MWRFFPDDTITQDGMKAAETAARVELETLEDRFKNLGWERAYGASGTILAVHTVIRPCVLHARRHTRPRSKGDRDKTNLRGCAV